jgi:hypothetical protein
MAGGRGPMNDPTVLDGPKSKRQRTDRTPRRFASKWTLRYPPGLGVRSVLCRFRFDRSLADANVVWIADCEKNMESPYVVSYNTVSWPSLALLCMRHLLIMLLQDVIAEVVR